MLTVGAFAARRRFRTGSLYWAAGLGSILLLAFAAPVAAQEPGPVLGSEAELEESGQGKGVEEIIVRARKREERLQEVPVSVTALTGSTLDARKIDDALDIQFEVPNLFFSKTNFTGSNLQIRGIGNQVVAASADQAVGIHVNTVPLTTSRIFEQEFFDVERIEVLRGPQGTLFGRNSTGGSFNVYTRKPGPEWESDAEIEYGSYQSFRFKGAINAPITDILQMRVAGMFHRRDGWMYNIGTQHLIDDRLLGAVRGSFRLQLGDDTTVDAMVSYFKEKDGRSRIGKQLCTKDTAPFPTSLGCTNAPPGFGALNSYSTLGGIFDTVALTGIGLPGLYPTGVDANAAAVNPPDLFTHNSRIDPSYEADEILAILDVGHQLDDLAISWVTGYLNTSVNSQQDYNMVQPSLAWTPASIAIIAPLGGITTQGPPGAPTGMCFPGFGCADRSWAQDDAQASSEQISTELRAVSDRDSNFNYTVGAIYSYFVTRTDYFVFFSGAEVLGSLAQAANPARNPELNHFNNQTDPARTKSFGLYGEVYYDFTDATKLTLGARYTYDNKTARSRQYLLDASGQLPLFANQQASWNNGTGVISLKHDFDFSFTDQSMAYASISRGFKPGGFNPPAVAGTVVPLTFDPETVWAYEVGTKNQWWNSRVQTNLTGFFYDYRDYQISKIVARTSVNENINAYIWGLEAEFVVVPIDDMQINASLAYLGSSIQGSTSIDPSNPTAGSPNFGNLKDLTNGSNLICALPAPGVPVSCPNLAPPYTNPPTSDGIATGLAGKELPNTPDIQINIGVQYTFGAPLIGGDLTPRMSYYWQSSMWGRIFNTPRDMIPTWSQFDAGIRWADIEGRYYVDLWCRNFTDNRDITGQYFTDATSGNFTNVFVLHPRTFGVTVGAAF